VTAGNVLGLAASPSFALMAVASASNAPAHLLCSSPSGPLSFGSMAAMYLVMSLFHLSPWLKLFPGGSETAALTIIEGNRP
jgi:hypothetical protein